MASRWIASFARPGLLRALSSHVRLAIRLVREPLVPRTTKAWLALPALYLLSPVDLLPDVILGLGQLDDLGVILIGLQVFVSLCPRSAVGFHQLAIDRGERYTPMKPVDTVIDAQWRRG
jgi:uncharacterized membrane protein YkvA (DUF1232 family)